MLNSFEKHEMPWTNTTRAIIAVVTCAMQAIAGRENPPVADAAEGLPTRLYGAYHFYRLRDSGRHRQPKCEDDRGRRCPGLYGRGTRPVLQDRDGAPGVIEQACGRFPTLDHFFADSGYSGRRH